MPDSSYLDWPFLDASHRGLKTELDQWCEANSELLDPQGTDRESDLDAACRGLVRLLGEGGWLKYSVPSIHGETSQPLDVRSLCILRETLAYHSGLADFCFAMQGLGSGPISFFGSPRMQETWLPAVASGKSIAAFALSEKEAGSDVSAMTTRAERDGDHYILNGEKTWISNAGIADFYTVFARTGEAPGARGLSAFVVAADTPGLTISERINIIAPHPLGTLDFQDCAIPARQLLGEPGRGFQVAMATLDVFRTTVAAAALGFARRACDETLAHVLGRELFGAPLAELQMTQASIADMVLNIDTSALLIYRSAWAKDGGQDRVTREAAMAKLHATEQAQKVIDRAVQLFGGLGVTSGQVVERLYREIRSLRIYEGASEVQKVIIARNEYKNFGKRSGQT
jgi:acyl-CoA dehydrogenase